MIAGEMEVELVPQGTLIERIRAGGLRPGRHPHADRRRARVVEEGKRKIEVDGRDYLLETPLRADFALVQAFLCRLPRQPHLRADGAQLQSGDRDGRADRDRRRRAHRAGRA